MKNTKPGDLVIGDGRNDGVRRITSQGKFKNIDRIEFDGDRPAIVVCNVTLNTGKWCLIVDETNIIWELENYLKKTRQ